MGHFDGAGLNSASLKAYQAYMEGHYTEAVIYAREIYTSNIAYYGPLHSQTINTLNNLVLFLQADGKEEEARIYAQEAYDKCCRVYGEQDPYTEKAKSDLDKLMLQA